jgi:hypothetical protein
MMSEPVAARLALRLRGLTSRPDHSGDLSEDLRVFHVERNVLGLARLSDQLVDGHERPRAACSDSHSRTSSSR